MHLHQNITFVVFYLSWYGFQSALYVALLKYPQNSSFVMYCICSILQASELNYLNFGCTDVLLLILLFLIFKQLKYIKMYK